MTLPHFLIIGAMKSGSTTLYRDLLENRAVFFPVDKEPGNLAREHVLTADGLRDYEKLYRRASPTQVCGDASTDYSKLPDVRGVPERAFKVLGDGLKIVYVVREPVERIVSQYRHELAHGVVSEPLDEALRSHGRYVSYSSYAMQATPWIEAFGPGNVMVVIFDMFVAARKDTVAQISEFLGVSPDTAGIDESAVFKRAGSHSELGRWRMLQESAPYQRLIRPMLSAPMRERIGRMVLRERSVPAESPSPESVEFLLDGLGGDIARYSDVPGLSEAPWTLDTLREKYHLGPASS